MLWLWPDALASPFWEAVGARVPLLLEQYRFNDTTDFARSSVHLVDWGAVYLNVTQRDGLLRELIERLLSISDPDANTPVFSAVYQPHEIYEGPLTRFAPDLTLDYFASRWSLNKGMPANARPRARYFVPPERWYGDHTRDGIFVFAGETYRADSLTHAARIIDVPATLLHLHGLPIPDDWDGTPLLDLFDSGFAESHEVTSQPGDDPALTALDYDYSAQETIEVSARLKALGYLA